MNNRKARLLLGVPARSELMVVKYNTSNRCAMFVYAGQSSAACKPSRAQRRFKWQLRGDNFHHPVAEDRAK